MDWADTRTWELIATLPRHGDMVRVDPVVLAEAIAAALREAAGRWVPVSERLPEDQRLVLVPGGCAIVRDGRWYSITDEGWKRPRPITWGVTKWMPHPDDADRYPDPDADALPAPPEVER